jgi:dipeptidase
MPRGKWVGSKTPTADYDAVPRQIDIDKVSDEEIQDIVISANLTPRKCLGLQDPFSGNPQRAWQRRANPVCIALLHLAPESRN